MKKILLILGIVIILIAGAVWTYIFLYGVPQSADEIFGRFTTAPERSGGGNETNGQIDTGSDSEDDGNYESRARLYQLTTRPVAGATIVDDAVRYVEKGTGHVYEIALTGGSERMVSGTTLPRTIRAVFSPTGEHVALTSESEAGLSTVLGTLMRSGGDGSVGVIDLPTGAREVAFDKTGAKLNFFVPTNTGGSGYAYDLETEETSTLFNIPLRDVRVLWGKKTYIVTTPSAYALGYVYQLGTTGLEYITEGGKGLMAHAYASGTILSSIVDGALSTRDVVYGDIPLLTLFPEKCANTSSRIVFCASPLTLDSRAVYPDDWYKGKASFSDMILRIDAPSSTVMAVSKLEEESGRPIDVIDIGTSADGQLIHFINKYDGALWMLDLR